MTFTRSTVVSVAVAAIATLTCPVGAADLAVWNYEIMDNASRVTEPGPIEPITIAAARNGTFSGAVAVESAEAIAGLHASLGPLSLDGAEIGTDRTSVRYAVAWTGARNAPGGLDILLKSPPAEVPVDDGRALAGIWVTVDVPEDARPGVYRGELTVEAEGAAAQTIPVEVDVADWRAPDPTEQRTWVEVIQSPDTLAMEYDVPLWSDRHWELIAESFRVMRATGSRVVYVPLLRNTNQGNAESMVRWIPQDDGTYKQDYTPMEKYLDVAEENLGTPELVVFYAWDAYLATSYRGKSYEDKPTVNEEASRHAQTQQRRWQQRWEMRQQGLTVTMLDEATGETSPGTLPLYTEAKSRRQWKPVWDELHRRMKRRGLEDAMVLGMINDIQPSKPEVEFLADVSGGLSWVSHAHVRRTLGKPSPNTVLHGIADIRYEAHAYGLTYHVHPDNGQMHGWRAPELRVYLDRFGLMNGHALRVREMPQLNITGNQRGVGRIGGDIWPAMRDRRGQRTAQVFARYPANHWRGLNIGSWLLAPGPDGPVSTARLENFCEGVQECEARIQIERALLDPEQKARLGADLATRARKVLDDHQWALWRSIWTNEEHLKLLGAIEGRSMHEAIWGGLKKAGIEMPGFWEGEARQMRSKENTEGLAWFVGSGWQQRTRNLFATAAEVQKRLK